jgi:hypothetical protein
MIATANTPTRTQLDARLIHDVFIEFLSNLSRSLDTVLAIRVQSIKHDQASAGRHSFSDRCSLLSPKVLVVVLLMRLLRRSRRCDDDIGVVLAV